MHFSYTHFAPLNVGNLSVNVRFYREGIVTCSVTRSYALAFCPSSARTEEGLHISS